MKKQKRKNLEGNTDLFSMLPRDCLISVFRLLNRKTLNEIELVSKQMGEIVANPVLRRIKMRGSLSLFEYSDSGRSFQFVSGETCLLFTVPHGAEQGRRSSIKEGDIYPFGPFVEPVTPGVATIFPRSIWTNLSELTKRHHAFDSVLLDRILIDNRFIAELFPFLQGGQRSIQFEFNEVLFDDSLEFPKFSKFLLAANPRFLWISRNHQLMPRNTAAFLSIFDEKFLTAFAANCANESPSFGLEIFCGMDRIPFHWTPSREFLPILCRFERFVSASMKLRPEHFLELISMRVETADRTTLQWLFSLTAELKDEHFDSSLDSANYAHMEMYYDDTENDDQHSWFHIQQVGTPKACRFYQFFHARTREFMVEIEFFEKEMFELEFNARGMVEQEKRRKIQEETKVDFFSQLPRDCHISVFRLLNRKTFNELECVSKQMGESFALITETSHAIQFLCDDWGARYGVRCGEQRGHWSHCAIRSESQMPLVLSNVAQLTPGGAKPMPAAIWTALARLFKQHEFDHVYLERIRINAQFLDEFRPFLTGPKHVELVISEVFIDESVNMSKFSEFLLSANLRYLRISRGRQALPSDMAGFLGIFEETFLTAFAAKCIDESPSFVLGIFSGMNVIPYHWIASRDFIPVLSRFVRFSSESMKIHPEDFLELILIRLETAIDYTLFDTTRSYANEYDDFEEDEEEEEVEIWKQIQKNGTSRSCKFNRYVDTNTNELMVELEFSGEGESIYFR
uniref:F-box domain-containing protein n=1 Tax=Pristionchus pacificus TaxID=54126 RepID=A0A8R1U3I7_PRIPA